MKVTKAVITAGGVHQRSLPFQTLIDQDGRERSVLGLLIGEALDAGIEDVAVVVAKGDADRFRAVTEAPESSVQFLVQSDPRGYGHALYCARDFVGDGPFLHLVGDHLPVSHAVQSCGAQLLDVAASEGCAVSAVQPTPERDLFRYGTIGGRLVTGSSDRYVIERVAEKPTPTEAEQELVVPGLRAGSYLCLFGLHVLPASIFADLENALEGTDGPIALSPVLDALARRERYLAFEIEGSRYDVGAPYGLLYAQLALAFGGAARDEVLRNLVEMLAQRCR
ncbi:MAG: sugar phosphate nucleotidyltransferase [Planctomycetota bacterium]